MQTLVIAGSASNIGKTTLREAIKARLSNFRVHTLKIGHGSIKAENETQLFHSTEEALAFVQQKRQNPADCDLLLIESSQLLLQFTPDLSIFLHDESQPAKPWSHDVMKKCDIILRAGFDQKEAGEKIKKVFGSDMLSDLLSQHLSFLLKKPTHASS